ncbi:MAG: protein kinase [Labilithrix sp.]|nr:protein kinase [Labilithrix sp.]MCW5809534.1 protein kinase [Labilithrix sp.]
MTASAFQGLLAERFVIEREVGRGGVGIVYRARDEVSGAPVALKVIAIPGVDAGEEARFGREGRVLAGLSHPGIVRVVAFGQLDEGHPYVAMEWLEGEDIQQRQKRAPLSFVRCLEVAAQVAEALAYAHGVGIVHRDIKPSNVILVGSRAGEDTWPLEAKLVDFGVASAEDARLTRTGAIIGTPAYMAPEQARGDAEVDPRSDIYALGATLFEMIAGRPPHVGPTPIAILARLVTTPAPRLGEVYTEAPVSLDDLLCEMLATHPEERPARAADVAMRLRAIAADVEHEVVPIRAPISEQMPMSMGEIVLSASGTASKSGGSRLVTSILATHVPKGPARQRLIAHLRARGAEATELGGDAIVAHLGVKKALGDEAARALDLGLRLAKMGSKVGVATGRTRIDRTRPTGEVVDRAAALARDAQKTQVLADTTTSELARGRFEMQVRADGTSVVGPKVTAKKEIAGGSPFVGREADLSQAVSAYERCMEDETPIIVTLTGAPGIGKTRLRREALARVASHPSSPRVVMVRAESFAKSHALGIMADVARGLAGVSKGADLDASGTAIDALLGRLGLGEPEARDLVARLIANVPLPEGADGRAARDALWIALTEMALRMSRESALVIAIEDAQWADLESLSWIDHLLARAAGHPVFVLATARPTLWRDDPARWNGRDHVRIELRPLARRTVRAIAKAILGEKATSPEGEALVESISAQAGGSPLFAEELARLAHQGRDAASAPTIEAAIQVHLDALDEEVREAAMKLSIFGLQVWDAGLEALGVKNAGEVMKVLTTAEVVLEQASSRFKDTREWAFKHALTREVAYASLGEEHLKELHTEAGHWLAKMGEDDAIVARHLELGGQPVEAAVYVEKAARRALAASALGEAVRLAEKSLDFAIDNPTQFARAQLLDEAWVRLDARAGERDTAVRAMQEAVYDEPSAVRALGARVRYENACGGRPDTSASLEEVIRRAKAAGLWDEEARSAADLAARYAFAGELDKAAAWTDSLLALARDHSLPGAAVDAYQTLAVVRQARGDVGAALEARRSAVRAASEAGLKTREATLNINVGFALTTMGAKDEARAAIESGIALAQAVGSPGTVRHGQMNLLCWTATFGSDSAHDTLLADPRAIADNAVSGAWVPHDRATLGVLFYRGAELLRTDAGTRAPPNAAEQARTLLKTASGGYRATKMLDVVPVALGFWSEAERRLGQAERAVELATEAASLIEDGSPSLLNEAPIFLALHDALFDLGRTAEAKHAIARGLPRLVTRVNGLRGTPHARDFLSNVASNAGLLAAAEGYGIVPPELSVILSRP